VPKTDRKSPRPRVAISSGLGAPAKLSFDAEVRKQIESEYGSPLSEEDHVAIEGTVNSYLRWQPFERAAPFKQDVERTLSGAVKHLNAALTLLDTSGRNGEAAEEYLARAASGRDFRENLTALMNDCRSAMGLLRNDAEFREGDAFKSMICELSDYLDRRGLPIAASKGQDKARSPKTSPFVRLLRQLLRALPDEFRRNDHSDEALAKAIGDARREHRTKAIGRSGG
jgi:hypothetical protein